LKTPAQVPLKEDDFPSLSAAMVMTPMTPAYSAQPRKHSSFQEEDFPALVSKIRPPRPAGGATSAWSQASSSNTSKTVILPSSSSRPPPNNPPLPLPAGPQLLSSSSSSRRKKHPIRRPSPPSDDDNCVAKTMQEHRAVPTMLDISSLLIVKGPSKSASKPLPLTAKPLPPTAKPPPLTDKPLPLTSKPSPKENVPESHASKPLVAMTTATVKTAVKAKVKASGLANGHLDKPVTVAPLPKAQPEPPLEVEEEFPALISKKPPPGT
ncbi:unnamed protein product, partial [Oncorhynchus mykiss]